MIIHIPKELKDCRNLDAIAVDAQTADLYAEKGHENWTLW